MLTAEQMEYAASLRQRRQATAQRLRTARKMGSKKGQNIINAYKSARRCYGETHPNPDSRASLERRIRELKEVYDNWQEGENDPAELDEALRKMRRSIDNLKALAAAASY